jgi:SAM-dependent methyltransferase
VGCGLGNFTSKLLDRELVVALDIEPDCVERLKQRYANRQNLLAFTCDAQRDGLRDFARFRPDSCVCLNVLEHIAEDRRVLSEMVSMLVPGGVIILLVPAFPALYGPTDEKLGHERRYTRESMCDLAKKVGVRIRKVRYINAVGFFGWWANSHIFRREAQSERQIEIFDRLIVPVISRVESVIPPPFGQSLFVVLEKSGGRTS